MGGGPCDSSCRPSSQREGAAGDRAAAVRLGDGNAVGLATARRAAGQGEGVVGTVIPARTDAEAPELVSGPDELAGGREQKRGVLEWVQCQCPWSLMEGRQCQVRVFVPDLVPGQLPICRDCADARGPNPWCGCLCQGCNGPPPPPPDKEAVGQAMGETKTRVRQQGKASGEAVRLATRTAGSLIPGWEPVAETMGSVGKLQPRPVGVGRGDAESVAEAAESLSPSQAASPRALKAPQS